MDRSETIIPFGAFDLHGPIGTGGMGEVWLAEHREQKIPVAIKILVAERVGSEQQVSQAVGREVQAAAALNHPGIVAVYDFGVVDEATAELSGDRLAAGNPWFVMELARSGTLDTFRPQHYTDLQRILAQILDALAHAHARGVIHRDLKPSNALLTERGRGLRVKLTDFGIAFAIDHLGAEQKPMMAAGTPGYMAPEQLRGLLRDQGPWTDLYGLGCMAFELATGTMPFDGDSMFAIMAAHFMREPVAFEPLFDVPDEFEAWIHTLLAKERQDRFTHAADALWALSRLSEGFDSVPSDEDLLVMRVSDEPVMTLSGLGPGELALAPAMPTLVSSPTVDTRTTQQESKVFEVTVTAAVPAINQDTEPRPTLDLAAPPIPRDWRTSWDSVSTDRHAVLAGVGLGLVGWRQVPFVGRNDERDRIWEALLEAASTQTGQCLLIRGGSGCGKTRLAQWMCRRMTEMGAATTLELKHSAFLGPDHGIRGLIERHARCHGLPSDEVESRLIDTLGSRADEIDRRRCAAVAGWLRPEGKLAETGSKIVIRDDRELIEIVAQLARVWSRQRPAVLWLDEPAYDRSSVALVAQLLATRTSAPAPIVILITQTNGQSARFLDDTLAAFDEHVTTIELGNLDDDASRAFVDRLLPLDPVLRDEVVLHCRGRPGYAVELVGQWVAEGQLVADADGFRRRRPDEELAADPSELWPRRLAGALGDNRPLETVLRAVQAVALLGGEVRRDEWLAVCKMAALADGEAILAELSEHGLAVVREDGSWRLPPGGLCDGVLQLAIQDDESYQSLHALCGNALALVGDVDPIATERIGRHFLEGGYRALAIEALWDAAQWYRRHRRLDQLSAILRPLSAAFGHHDPELRDPRNQLVTVWRGTAALQEGDVELARRCAQLAVKAGAEVGGEQQGRLRDVAFAEAQVLRGNVLMFSGDVDRARSALEHALEVAERSGDPACHARALNTLARIERRTGHSRTAAGRDAEAFALFRRASDEVSAARCGVAAALSYITCGDLSRAWPFVEFATTTFERHSAPGAILAQVYQLRGEYARHTGQRTEAERYFGLALAQFQSAHTPPTPYNRYNIALLHLGRGEYTTAGRLLADLIEEWEKSGQLGELPGTYGVYLPCLAVAGAYDEADRALDRIVELQKSQRYVDLDMAMACLSAGDLFLDAKRPALARRCYELSREQWEILGNAPRTAELQAILAGLTTGRKGDPEANPGASEETTEEPIDALIAARDYPE